MKKLFSCALLIACFISSTGQNTLIDEIFKKQFHGKWSADTKYQTNTIEIKFEAGKNYATVIDIGSGEAPPMRLQAFRQHNKLIINPIVHRSDYCELAVKNGKLIFKTYPTIWDSNNKPKPPGKNFVTTVFSKSKK